MQNDIVRLLKQDSARDAFFTSMIDLYALHKEFPGTEEAEQYRNDPFRRVKSLEESWAKETNDPRFILHIQLHEYEAYLFSDVSVLSRYYENRGRAIGKLKEIADGFDSPELIDDGQETAPSKRIIDHLPSYENDKSTVGVQAAERIGLPGIRCRCPHFDWWIDCLQRLAA